MSELTLQDSASPSDGAARQSGDATVADRRPPRQPHPTPPPVAAGTGRLAVLDGLRLLAAIAVVGKHWIGSGVAHLGPGGKMVHAWNVDTTAGIFGWLHAPSNYGWLGVHLFFLISGFVICMSTWGRTLGQFFTSRVTRLFPAYWFAVVVTAAVAIMLPGLTRSTPAGSDTGILLNLTMVHRAFGVRHVDPSYWTLWIELRFYLLFAVVVAFGLTYRRVVAFCVLWVVAAVVAAGSGDQLVGFGAMPEYAPYFVAGIAFYLIYRHGPNLLLWGIIGFSWLLSLRYLHDEAASNMRYNGVEPSTPILIAIVTGCFVLIGLVALHVFDRITWRWLTVAGALTYPLYLLHQVIGFIAIHYLRAHLPPWAVIGILFVGMLTAAWLVWRFVERPMARWLRRGLVSSFEAMRQPERRTAARPVGADAGTPDMPRQPTG